MIRSKMSNSPVENHDSGPSQQSMDAEYRRAWFRRRPNCGAIGDRAVVEVSVLICTRNRPDDLRRVLGSLLADVNTEAQIIVVDQSDSVLRDEVARVADQPRVLYVRSETRG